MNSPARDEHDRDAAGGARRVDDSFIRRAREQVEEAEAAAGANTEWDQFARGRARAGASDLPFDLPADAFPGYRLIREIHRGGQGVVFQAVQIETNRKVAIKVIGEGPFAGDDAKERFKREIELIAALDHPNIVKVVGSGVSRGFYFYAMDYIRGKRFDESVHGSNVPVKQMLATFTKVCDAVDYAHRRGIVHRDLKPSNILVDHRGEPHVLDFGMAKSAGGRLSGQDGPILISLSGQVLGTLPYMSPEQASGDSEHVDSRTDIYSLGVILYQLLTGAFPYNVVGNMREVLDNILKAAPRRPSAVRRKLDNDLETIVLKALSKEPERRYQSASEFGKDLAHFLAGEPIEAKRDRGWYLFRKRVSHHRRSIATFGLIGATVLGAGYLTVRSATELDTVRQKTEALARELNEYRSQALKQEIEAELSGRDRPKPEPPPADLRLVDRDATVRAAIFEDVGTLAPFWPRNEAELTVLSLLFDSLCELRADFTFHPNERLCAIEATGDPRIRIVRLKPNLHWHDGSPITPEDIVFSWKAACEVPDAARHAEGREIESISKEGEEAVRVVFKSPDADWKRLLNFELIPRETYSSYVSAVRESAGADGEWPIEPDPVGCGPYRLASMDEDTLTLERFEDAGPRPLVNRVVLRKVSPADQLSLFMKRELDLIRISESQATIDAYTAEFTSQGELLPACESPYSNFLYVLWNCDHASGSPFADRRVRRAMAHAIHVQQIRDQASNRMGMPCGGPFPVDSPYFHPDVRLLRFDPALAARLLREAGFDAPAGRGTATSAPTAKGRLAFRLAVPESSATCRKIAEIVRASLHAIGVEVTTEPLSTAGPADDTEYRRRMTDAQFDAIIGEVRPSVDVAMWREYYGTKSRRNFGRYSNSEVDELFAKAASTADPQVRAASLRRVHRVIYEDQPMLFLYHRPDLWARSRSLRNVELSPSGPLRVRPGVLDWWVRNSESSHEQPVERSAVRVGAGFGSRRNER
ncbi:MAG: ABC transporter substrate-binding protein [Phycisphaerae bacterium]|nr:ABC transporter substrate-binding protein [Phycisphaerae bacterium]